MNPIRSESLNTGWGLAILALLGPTLIAAHDPPSVTFYNQALAALGWGLWLAWLGVHSAGVRPSRTISRASSRKAASNSNIRQRQPPVRKATASWMFDTAKNFPPSFSMTLTAASMPWP